MRGMDIVDCSLFLALEDRSRSSSRVENSMVTRSDQVYLFKFWGASLDGVNCAKIVTASFAIRVHETMRSEIVYSSLLKYKDEVVPNALWT